MKSARDGSIKWVGFLTTLIFLFLSTSLANAAGVQPRDDKMSVMGKRAAAAVTRPPAKPAASAIVSTPAPATRAGILRTRRCNAFDSVMGLFNL